ncbi:Interleukin-13 receptor subunit alpha-2 [Myotis brandtii]|uniref:Interleukin-13 receptor subunit alpha-2 n=1 Tax=Myotis brandtii TaxID=109478 RepID=S7PYZ2_MYOBR|nr:Interleukin-13 receptor subunit alpha-2 [Myotis brandtii]
MREGEIEDNSQVSGLGNWEDDDAIYWYKKTGKSETDMRDDDDLFNIYGEIEQSFALSEAFGVRNLETKIQDMNCIYYNWQYLLCSWKLGMDVSFDTNYYLFYWYEGLDHALQCSDYIEDNGKNIGCRFSYLEEPDYKDFYICVNGSSKSQLIRPSYFIFQLQNIVKPLPPDYLNIVVKKSEDINLEWNIPEGPIPANCFIYEIKFTEDNTTWMATTFENQMYVTRTSNDSQEICFLVRSKMNVYCTDDGIWSEWSEIECWKGVQQEEILSFLIPFAFILFLILVITCLLVSKQKTLQKMVSCITL